MNALLAVSLWDNLDPCFHALADGKARPTGIGVAGQQGWALDSPLLQRYHVAGFWRAHAGEYLCVSYTKELRAAPYWRSPQPQWRSPPQ